MPQPDEIDSLLAEGKKILTGEPPKGCIWHKFTMSALEMAGHANAAGVFWNILVEQGLNRVQILMVIAILIQTAQDCDNTPDEVIEFTLRNFRHKFADVLKPEFNKPGEG